MKARLVNSIWTNHYCLVDQQTAKHLLVTQLINAKTHNRGLGMSSGGSAMAVAAALAYETPVEIDKAFVDRVLARAQELGPGGVLPYGRGAHGPQSSEPSLMTGAAAAGRHGRKPLPKRCATTSKWLRRTLDCDE